MYEFSRRTEYEKEGREKSKREKKEERKIEKVKEKEESTWFKYSFFFP